MTEYVNIYEIAVEIKSANGDRTKIIKRFASKSFYGALAQLDIMMESGDLAHYENIKSADIIRMTRF